MVQVKHWFPKGELESGAIKWLKSQTHALLDRTDAPASAWFFAAEYLASIWNRTWHPAIKMTPHQARHGVPPDISPYLQFSFWEPVLHLDHESTFPHTKERSGRWVGVSHHVGDIMTYKIIDDQSKHLLHGSVVRPFGRNRRVKWDPAFDTNSRNTAQHGGTSCPHRK